MKSELLSAGCTQMTSSATANHPGCKNKYGMRAGGTEGEAGYLLNQYLFLNFLQAGLDQEPSII